MSDSAEARPVETTSLPFAAVELGKHTHQAAVLPVMVSSRKVVDSAATSSEIQKALEHVAEVQKALESQTQPQHSESFVHVATSMDNTTEDENATNDTESLG